MTYALKDINPVYALNGIEAMRRAADVIEAVAIGDEKHAGLVLIARFAERYALGTACEDEAAALARLFQPERRL
jgi:hypothetical protein